MKDFTYRYYEYKNNCILAVYSFLNGRFIFIDGDSTKALYLFFEKKHNKLNNFLSEINVNYEDFLELLPQFNEQIKEKNEISFSVGTEQLTSTNINDEILSYGYLYAFHIDVTSKCNLRCRHCYHPFDEYNNHNQMNLNDIKVLLHDLYELGVFRLTLSGGEPFLRTDLEDILKECDKYGFVVEIYTNGTLLTEDKIKMIKSHNVAMLSFSCYGNEKASLEISGYHNFYKSLLYNTKLCKKYDLLLEWKYIIMKNNIDDISDIILLCKELNVPIKFEMSLIPKLNKSDENLLLAMSIDDYISLINKHKNLFLYDNPSGECRKVCNAGKYSMYCNFEGDIFPCVSYKKHLGRFSDIIHIWNDTKSKQIVPSTNQYKSFGRYSYCKYCYQICPALSELESTNNDSLDCHNSSCIIAQAIEKINM